MDYQKKYARQHSRALKLLVDWCNGSLSQLAAVAGVTPAAVLRWQENGRISIAGAVAVARHKDCPLTKEEMRPDVKVWPEGGND